MNTQEDQKARYKAAAHTAMGNLNQRIDTNTKRMAGAALATAVLPGAMSWVDDQETSILGFLASGALSTAGIAGGGYLGYRNAHVPEDTRDQFIRNEVDKLKAASKVAAKDIGPEAAVEQFARDKQMLLEDIASIDPKRAAVINRELNRIPEIGPILKEMDLGNKSPRDVRGIGRGALTGAALSLIPAYLALRNGEVES